MDVGDLARGERIADDVSVGQCVMAQCGVQEPIDLLRGMSVLRQPL
jgi:hypothetical protein